MLLEYFNLSAMSLGSWDEINFWLNRPGPNLVIIAGVVLFLIFSARRLRGFWGFAVYLVSGGLILLCLNNIVRFW